MSVGGSADPFIPVGRMDVEGTEPMIQDVDETLRGMLLAELADVFQCPVHREAQITFEPPELAEKTVRTEPGINLYLFDIRENTALREAGSHLVRDRQSGAAARRRPPLLMDLSYLITTYGAGDMAAEHRLLTDVLRTLARHPQVPMRHLKGAFAGDESAVLLVSAAQPSHPAHTNSPGLWQALGGRLRPALGLTITAPFHVAEPKWEQVVREAVIGLGIGIPPDGPRRPLEIGGVRVSIAGVVAAKEDEQPLEGVLVTVQGRTEQARTDARGFFHMIDLPPQKYTLRFEKRGFQTRADIEVTAPPPGRPDLLPSTVVAMHAMEPAERRTAEAALTQEAWNLPGFAEAGRIYHVSLTGRLCLEDGRPAAFIPVRAGRKETTTDAEGVYSFIDLPDARPIVEADVPGVGTVSLAAGDARGAQIVPFPPKKEAREGQQTTEPVEAEPPRASRAKQK